MNTKRFNIGDEVVALGNYHDEQLGQYATTVVQTIIEVDENEGNRRGDGQLVKTDKERDWVSSAWFGLASECKPYDLNALIQANQEQAEQDSWLDSWSGIR